MTTIAYRDGVLAADTLATREGVRSSYQPKIHKLPDGRLLAKVGNAPTANALKRWIEAGAPEDSQPEGEAAIIVFSANGAAIYEDGGCEPVGDGPFFAWGCGSPIALGAMAAGATAEQAVRIACEWDSLTGGEVTVLEL